jgi:hypothetical protein
VLEQLFWNRGVSLDVLPGASSPDVFAAAHVPLARVRGPVVLDESGEAIVPAEQVATNGPWVEAATGRAAATLDGLAGGWLSPRGSGQMLLRGRLTFTVTSPTDNALSIGGRHMTLHAGRPASVCVAGSFAYRFSRHVYLGGYRPVAATATFPRFRPGPC